MIKARKLITNVGRQPRPALIGEPDTDKISNLLQLLQSLLRITNVEIIEFLMLAALLIASMGDMRTDVPSDPVQIDKTCLDPRENGGQHEVTLGAT